MSKRLLFLPIFLLFYSNSFAMSARLSAIARRAIPYLNRGAAAAKQATAKTVSTAKAAVKQISESKPVLRAKTSSILPKMQKVGLQGLNNNIVKTSAIFAAGLGATTLYYKEPIIDYELQTKIMIKNGIQKYSYSEIKDIIKAYPEAAKLFAPVMVNNLDKFTYSIAYVIKAYPEAAKLFAPEMLKNLDKFASSIADVIKAYPEAAKLFAPEMLKNLDKFTYSIAYVIKAYPEAAKLFAPVMVNNLDKFEDYSIANVIKAYPEAAKLFAPTMVNNLDKFTYSAIADVIEAYPEAAKLFVPEMLKNLDKFEDYLIVKVIKAYPEAAKLFVQEMLKNLDKFPNYSIAGVIEAYPEAAKLFVPEMLKNLDKFEDYLIVKVIKAYPEAAKLFVQEMLKNLDKFPNSAIADVIEAYPEAAKLFAPKMPLLNGAQSSAHILTHLKHIIDKSNEAALEEQFVKALEKEESILDEHYIPVYHGHRVEYDFLHIAVSRAIHDIRIHNCRLTDLEVLKITRESLLRTLSKDNESFNRFLQLSFIPRSNGQLLDHFYIQTPGKILELIDDKDEYKQVYKQEKNRQQEMMIDRPYAERRIRDPKRMSANPFLFSNTHNSGSCTFAYVQNNYNVHGIQIDWKRDFFNPLGASKQTMQIFTQRFENLQKEYAKCFKRGCILQIALPKENIDELAYLAKIGAYRQTYYTKDRKPMIKLSEFLEETSRNNINPETIDEVELAVPLTQAGLLNPLNGIKIYRYMPKPINEQKYQEIMQEFEQLMQEFKEAIIKDREKNQKIKLAQDKQF